MVEAAHKEGKEPLVFLDEIVGKFSSLFKELEISYDQFIRTTDQKTHWPGAQSFGKVWWTRATYTRKNTKACTVLATKLLLPKRTWLTANA